MNARGKGLIFVREVKKILLDKGFKVEGPGYSMLFFDGRVQGVHRDYFGVADLMSWGDNQFMLHQITTISNRASHEKIITETGIPCWLWCRTEDRKNRWRVFFNGKEVEMMGFT